MFDETDLPSPEGEWSPDPDDDDPATWKMERFHLRFGTSAEEPPWSDVEPGAKMVSFGSSRGTCTFFPDGTFAYRLHEADSLADIPWEQDRDDPAGGGG